MAPSQGGQSALQSRGQGGGGGGGGGVTLSLYVRGCISTVTFLSFFPIMSGDGIALSFTSKFMMFCCEVNVAAY